MRINYSSCEKIDLGCGKNKREGFTGIDILDQGQEILCDVRNGIPLPDNSVSELYSSHFVEHLIPSELPAVFLEILRVCKDNSTVTIHCPEASTDEAYFNCHFSLWNEKKINGMCMGINGNTEIKATVTIEKFEVVGIEMRCILRIKK